MSDVAIEWIEVATLDDLWSGDMLGVEVEGEQILLIYPNGGTIRAYHGLCPHQQALLADGELEGHILTCYGHNWQFDVISGQGINPRNSRLSSYEVKIEGTGIYVGIPRRRRHSLDDKEQIHDTSGTI